MARELRVVCLAGDGIGPEIMRAARAVVDAAAERRRSVVRWEDHEAGEKLFARGVATGISREAIDAIAKHKLVLKGPLGTHVGHGGKSANVTLRKVFETYANVRPARELPGVETVYTGRNIDLVVVRENVEDLYAGIEHQQTPDVAQCLKLISRPGCEKVIRYAFELAIAQRRRTIHAVTKANIMKMTEGLFLRVFEDVARAYEGAIEARSMLVDNAAYQLVRAPEELEVLVCTNLHGDILSDLTSGLVGGLGFAPSANVGREVGIFEAVHGTAPDLAGTDRANPVALLLAAVMMLRHAGWTDVAQDIKGAVLSTLEDGIATSDVRGEHGVGTRRMAEEVIARLGRVPSTVVLRDEHKPLAPAPSTLRPPPLGHRAFAGVDVFIEHRGEVEELALALSRLVEGTPLTLKMISNRGTQVFPFGISPDTVDHWRCRFVVRGPTISSGDALVLQLLEKLTQVGWRWMHLELLQMFDGKPGWSLAQGEG